VAAFVIPYRIGGKSRLGDPKLALAMLSDVTDAVSELAAEALVVDGPGGQGPAVAAALTGLRGPVTIVNSDLPCATGAGQRGAIPGTPCRRSARSARSA